MLNDAPSQLLGLAEADIHRVLEEKLDHAMRDLKLSDEFLEPSVLPCFLDDLII